MIRRAEAGSSWARASSTFWRDATTFGCPRAPAAAGGRTVAGGLAAAAGAGMLPAGGSSFPTFHPKTAATRITRSPTPTPAITARRRLLQNGRGGGSHGTNGAISTRPGLRARGSGGGGTRRSLGLRPTMVMRSSSPSRPSEGSSLSPTAPSSRAMRSRPAVVRLTMPKESRSSRTLRSRRLPAASTASLSVERTTHRPVPSSQSAHDDRAVPRPADPSKRCFFAGRRNTPR